MASISIIRKARDKASKGRISKEDKDLIRLTVKHVSRVKRPALLAHFLGGPGANTPGEFFAMAPASQAAVKDPASLPLGRIEAWEVPQSDLGRKGQATASQAESIRLWLSKHVIGQGVVQADEVAVIFTPDEDDDSEA